MASAQNQHPGNESFACNNRCSESTPFFMYCSYNWQLNKVLLRVSLVWYDKHNIWVFETCGTSSPGLSLLRVRFCLFEQICYQKVIVYFKHQNSLKIMTVENNDVEQYK